MEKGERNGFEGREREMVREEGDQTPVYVRNISRHFQPAKSAFIRVLLEYGIFSSK